MSTSTALRVGLFCLCSVLIILVATRFRPSWLPRLRADAQSDKTQACRNSASKPPKLLLVSYDGFRWDYLDHGTVPNTRYLIEKGVTASKGLKNTFITITAPNHYGLVTGLYEENHGIVANDFYDPVLNERFDYFSTGSRTDPRFFNNGLPIWVVNDAAGGGRRTGCVMWVGCDVSIQGHPLPLYHISWNSTKGVNTTWVDRVDYVVSWFKDPNAPINLGLLYVEEPDETGHSYGPHGAPTLDKVREVDQLTGYLLWCLEREGLLDEVNMIFTSDHGMADVPYPSNVVYLGDYLDPDWYDLYGGFPGPNANILPRGDHKDDILNALKGVANINVYTNDTVPPEYHYSKTPRVMPVQVEAHLHYVIMSGKSGDREERIDDGHGRQIKLTSPTNQIIGAHGYNNSAPEMHPYFVGVGPAFKKGFAIETFENLDVYPLMAHILGVDPPPNNGSLERVKSLLAEDQCAQKDRAYIPNAFSQSMHGIRSMHGCHFGLVLILVMLMVAVVLFLRRGDESPKREKSDVRMLLA